MREDTGRKLGPAALPRLLIPIDEACRLLSVSRGTYHRLMVDGVVRSVKIGFSRRVLFEDIERISRQGTDHKAPRIGLDALREQERAAKAGTVTPARRRRHQTQPEAPR